MRKAFQVVVLIIILMPLLYGCRNSSKVVNAKIIGLVETEIGINSEYHLSLRITEGEYKGKVVQLSFMPIKFSQFDFTPEIGKTLIISLEHPQNGIHPTIVGISRKNHLAVLFLTFFGLLLIFGRKQGLLSIIALALSGLILFFFLIPMVLRGHNVLAYTVVSAVAVVTVSFVVLCGLTRKTLASILGTVGGIISAVIIAELFCRMSGITGSISEEAYLLVCENGVEIDFTGLFISGIIIGTIGVVMDVSMSITSTVFEFKNHSPNIQKKQLIACGLNVGKDIMATMINTLILAYVGTSMPLLFVFFSNASSLKYVISTELVAGEIIRSLCGSIGLILTVPLTSLIASYLATSTVRLRRYRR